MTTASKKSTTPQTDEAQTASTEADAPSSQDSSSTESTSVEPVEPDEDDEDEDDDSVVQPAGQIQETVEDRQGVSRLVNTYDDGWEPAPAEADPKAVKKAEKLAKRREKETKEGLEKLDAKRSNHAENKASDAGSGDAPAAGSDPVAADDGTVSLASADAPASTDSTEPVAPSSQESGS